MRERRKKRQNHNPGEVPAADGGLPAAEASPVSGGTDANTPASPREPEIKSHPRVKRLISMAAVILAFLLVLFVGLCVMLYPSISEYVNSKNQSRVIDGYKSAAGALPEADYSAELALAQAYNARLAGSGADVKDAFQDASLDTERSGDYWDILDVDGHGMVGYVEIEILDIMLPLYHGTSEAVLTMGVGHLQGSSLPVGGPDTHAVISAHTGLPSAKLFTGVDRLVPGDTFTLHVLNDMLTYEVDQILTVLPHEVEALGIESGSDYVTLVTCTPYGINSHRLLIRGARIETPAKGEDAAAGPDESPEAAPNWLRRTFAGVVSALGSAVEGVAQVIVNVTEWGMNLFGVEY